MPRCFYVVRRLVFASMLVTGLALGSGSASADCSGLCWTPRGSFAGIEFSGLYTVPDHPCLVAMTAFSNGGLKISTDCGQQFASYILTNVYDVTAKDPDVGYVAAGTQGVAKTIDGGGNWFQANQGLPVSADARAVVIHLGDPDSLFVGLHGDGVYVGGPISGSLVQWTPINQGLLDLSVRALVRVRGGTFMLAATEGGIWRRDNGAWTSVAPGVIANAFVIDSADSNRCYAATEIGFYKSVSGGRTWQRVTNGLPVVAMNDIARRTDNPNFLYLGTRGQGVYETFDQGVSWHKFGPDLPGENDARAVLCVVGGFTSTGAQVFAGTRVDGLYEATYSTPASVTTWGQIKETYRH